MVDIELIRKDSENIKKGIASKQADPTLVDNFLSVDKKWKELVFATDEMRSKQKKLGEERKIEEAKALKEEIKKNEAALEELETERGKFLRQIPNPPLASVPIGKNELENLTLKEVGQKPQFKFAPKNYVAIGESLGIIDTERAGKVSGSRFGYLLGAAVRLEFALVQLVLETVTDKKVIGKIIKDNKLKITDKPFIPVIPPVLVKKEMMAGMGYVERGEDEIYFLPKDELYLVGTSEQSIGPMHSGEIFKENALPVRYLGFSTCFRREAGSYGKDTRGILRVHQFDKLEMFSITKPEWSEEEHKLLLAIEEYLMAKLELPYRVLNICTGDLGDPAAAKFDIEAWLPGQKDGAGLNQSSEGGIDRPIAQSDLGEYRETHSTSNTTDFQSRRLNIKYRHARGDSVFTHMLNGTAFAIGRTLIAIFENYQREDGSISVPKALQKFTGAKEIKFQEK